MPVVGGEPAGAGEAPGDLDDQEALGVVPGAANLGRGAAGVQREAAPAVGVRRGGRGRHHPWVLLLQQGAKRRKSAGTKLMLAPASRSARSIGPKNPER